MMGDGRKKHPSHLVASLVFSSPAQPISFREKRPWRSRQVPDHEFRSIVYRPVFAHFPLRPPGNDVRASPAPALSSLALSCNPLTPLPDSPGFCSLLHGTLSPQLPQRPARSPSSSSHSQLPTRTSSTPPRSTFPTSHTSPWFQATLFSIHGLCYPPASSRPTSSRLVSAVYHPPLTQLSLISCFSLHLTPRHTLSAPIDPLAPPCLSALP